MEVSPKAPRLKVKSRRLLTAFSANLNRVDPQPLDWQRLYDFTLYAFGHEPPSAEAVGHALVERPRGWPVHGKESGFDNILVGEESWLTSFRCGPQEAYLPRIGAR
jgi:hypothetical protein